MMMSDFRPEVEIWLFRACTICKTVIRGTVCSVIVNLPMDQIPRSTEHISS